ncbi:hypothetical protein ABPG72_008625 [Tetrahymena utriculariae]
MYKSRGIQQEISQKTQVDKYCGILEEIQKKQNHLHLYDNYSPILISKQKIKFQEEDEFDNSKISQNCSILHQKLNQDQSLNQNSYIDNELNAIFHQAKKNRDFGNTFTLSNTGYSLRNSRQVLINSQLNSQRSLRCSKSMHQQSQSEIEFKNNSPKYQFYKHSYSRSRSNKNLISDSQITVYNERKQQSYDNKYDFYKQSSIKKNQKMNNFDYQWEIKNQIAIKDKILVNEELQYTYLKSKTQMKNYQKNEQISYQLKHQLKNLNDTKEILDNARINNGYEDIQYQSQNFNNKDVIFDKSSESTSKRTIENKENKGANYHNMAHKNNFFQIENQIQYKKKKSDSKYDQQSQTKQNNDSIIEFYPHQDIKQSKYGFIKHKEQYYKSRKFKTISQQCVEVEIVMPTEKSNKPPIIHHHHHNTNQNLQNKQEVDCCSDLQEVKKRLFDQNKQNRSQDSKIILNTQQKQIFYKLLQKKLIKTTQFYLSKWNKVITKPKKIIQKLTGIIQLSFKLNEIFVRKAQQYQSILLKNLKDHAFLIQLNKQSKLNTLLKKILKRKEQRQKLAQLVKYFERWRINIIDYILISKHLSRNDNTKIQSVTNQSHFTSQSTQNNMIDRYCASTTQTFRDQSNSNYIDLGLFCSSNTINSIQIKQRSESILSFNKSTESLQNTSQQTQVNVPQFWHSLQQIKQQK